MGIDTNVVIHASAEIVWDVLMDWKSFPEWNPFITSLVCTDPPGGPVKLGAKLKTYIQPVGARGMTFTPKVVAYDKNRKFAWLGSIPGLVYGEHIWEIADAPDGKSVTVRHYEHFTGCMGWLFGKLSGPPAEKGFILMNEKLKERVEARAAAAGGPGRGGRAA